MNRMVYPKTLGGTITAPASKSVAHRALICAALCDEKTEIVGKLCGSDIEATSDCLEALGAKIKKTDGKTVITPVDKKAVAAIKNAEMRVRDSGSTLRFMLSICSALGTTANFSGAERLAKRPLSELVDTLKNHSVTLGCDSIPLTVSGKLTAGRFDIGASVSSQYVSGLLMAAPLTGGDCEIKLSGDVASESYINLTADVMAKFGVNAVRCEDGWFVSKQEKYVSPKTFCVDGDWSNAAFFIVAAALSGKVSIDGLRLQSGQADEIILDLLKQAGGKAAFENGKLTVEKSELHAIDFDATDCPDIVTIAAVLLSKAHGVSKITGVSRLRFKESDRLAETVKLLSSFGIKTETDGQTLTVYGGRLTGGAEIKLPDDHRLAMAAAVAATAAEGAPTNLYGVECVRKSYPDFFDDFAKIGGQTVVFDV